MAEEPKYQMNIAENYKMFISDAWVIPAASAYTGLSETTIDKAWIKAQKQGKLCVLTVPGHLPPHKRCPICNVTVRREAKFCPTPKPNCEPYSWES